MSRASSRRPRHRVKYPATLIERLMTIALENAGADRGLLIRPARDEYLIQAEARATGDQIEVSMRQEPITGIACPNPSSAMSSARGRA